MNFTLNRNTLFLYLPTYKISPNIFNYKLVVINLQFNLIKQDSIRQTKLIVPNQTVEIGKIKTIDIGLPIDFVNFRD